MKVEIVWSDMDHQYDPDVKDIFHLSNGEILWHFSEPEKNYLLSLCHKFLNSKYGEYQYRTIIAIKVIA